MGLLAGWDDATLLFATLAALYLIECLVWTPIPSAVFFSWTGKAGTWLAASASLPLGARWLFAAPVLPTGRALVCGGLPILVGPTGVGCRMDPGQGGTIGRFSMCFVRVCEIRSVDAVGSTVMVNGQRIGAAASSAIASNAVDAVRAILAAPPELRDVEIVRRLEHQLNVRDVMERWNVLRSPIERAAATGAALFTWTFLIGPLAVYAARTFESGPTCLIAYLGAWTACWGAALYSAHALARALGQGAVAAFGRLVVSPAALMRSADALGRDAFADWDPLAIVLAVGTRQAAIQLVRRELRVLRHKDLPESVTDEATAQRWFDSLRERLVEAAADDAGLTAEELDRPPPPEGPDARSYCPRCESQFVLMEGVCPSCSQVRLRLFSVDEPPDDRPFAASL